MYDLLGDRKERHLISLAFDLFRLPSPSYSEELVREYVVTVLKRLGFIISIDASGNVLAVRGRCDVGEGYPLLSFHMDTFDLDTANTAAQAGENREVTESRKASHTLTHASPAILLENGRIHATGKHILGGDDKCGGAIVLLLAENNTLPLKVVASVQEELDCAGIKKVDPDFFRDVSYGLVLDRNGSHDLVTAIQGKPLCTQRFMQAMIDAGAHVGCEVTPVEGKLSDALFLSEYIENVVNMSVGYYNPHTVHEFVVIRDFFQAYRWIEQAVTTLPCALSSASKKGT